jgi:type IV pilus assembly protein PilV
MQLKVGQQGLTLMEILVTMFILAVGLLGVASMQVRAVQDSSNASYRSIAIFYANDIVDRIRANPAAQATYADEGNASADNCFANTCTAAQMAGYDIQTWLTNIGDALPAGSGELSVAAGNLYTVEVNWTDRVEQGANAIATSRVTLTFEP